MAEDHVTGSVDGPQGRRLHPLSADSRFVIGMAGTILAFAFLASFRMHGGSPVLVWAICVVGILLLGGLAVAEMAFGMVPDSAAMRSRDP